MRYARVGWNAVRASPVVKPVVSPVVKPVVSLVVKRQPRRRAIGRASRRTRPAIDAKVRAANRPPNVGVAREITASSNAKAHVNCLPCANLGLIGRYV